MENPSFSPLCSACTQSLRYSSDNAVSNETTTGSRHKTLQSIRQAAASGCCLCTTILENIAILAKQQPNSSRTNEQGLISDDREDTITPLYFQLYHENMQHGIPMMKLDVSTFVYGLYSLTKFRLIKESDAAAYKLLPATTQECHTASLSTLKLANSWYKSCLNNHAQCRRIRSPNAAKGWLPTRLLDIGIDGKGPVKLQHTAQDILDHSLPYITLSYRWGSEPQTLMLLFRTMSTLKQGLPLHMLPRTFQDLAIVAYNLSVRYVWIDALCIIQDSVEDWEREAPTMRHVYANAACTVSATASDSPRGGLFRHRIPSSLLPGVVLAPSTSVPQASSVSFDRYYAVDKTYWDRRIFNGPLHTRGWVFQERLLSARVLHFTKDQLMWECLTEAKCETFPQGIPFHTQLKDLQPLWKVLDLNEHRDDESRSNKTPQLEGEEHITHQLDEGIDLDCNYEFQNGVPEHELAQRQVASIWGTLVKLYSSCDLTMPDDKLPAFAGVAQLFQEVTGDEYMAGLWRSSLLDQMDWRVYQPATRKTSKYRAPSWSWASLDGPVRPMGLDSYVQFIPTLAAVKMKYQDSHRFGTPSIARLELLGHLTSVTVASFDGDSDLHHLLVGTNGVHVDAELLRDCLEVEFLIGSTIWCLPFKVTVGHSESSLELFLVCIVLEPIVCVKSPTFRRVGLLVVSDNSKDFGLISSFGLKVMENSIKFAVLEAQCALSII